MTIDARRRFLVPCEAVKDPLAAPLFAGDYETVLARVLAAPALASHPFAIGALALSGRLDEAETAAAMHLAGAEGRERDPVAARFFLTVGYCHAGRLGEAMRCARVDAPLLRSRDPRPRFHAAQGLALVRYFEGRLHKAATLAKVALAAAMETRSPYYRLLAIDLRGHVLVQVGEVFAGLRLLRQAEALARELRAEGNRRTIEIAILGYHVTRGIGEGGRALAELEAAIADGTSSFFAQRNGLLALAWARAVAGQRARAEAALSRAARIALPDGDRRGRTRQLVTEGVIRALGADPASTERFFTEAARMAGDDPSLQVEVAFAGAVAGRPDGERPPAARWTGIERSRPLDTGAVPSQDRVIELLRELRGSSPDAIAELLAATSMLGLLARALGLVPGRRCYLGDSRLVVEDHGEVTTRPPPMGPSRRILEHLRGGPCSRAELLRAVWGIGSYAPHRHDPALNTAVTRLRAALGPARTWIVTAGDRYQLLDGVEVIALTSDRLVTAAPASAPRDQPRSERALRSVVTRGRAGCAEVARDLRVSRASALRALTALVHQDKIVRVGKGKAARYQPLPGGGDCS